MSAAWIILLLFAGGGLAWLAEAWNPRWPVWVSLASLAAAGLVLANTLGTPIDAAALAGQYQAMASNAGPGSAGAAHAQASMAGLLDQGPWYSWLDLPWVPRFGIHVLLAMDGLSALLVGLTLALGVAAVVASWTEITDRPGFFQFNLLWTLAGVVGVFTALDLFLFFVFWEVMLVPMVLLIAIWGHESRTRAALKFFIFTQASGLLMLFAMVVLALVHADNSGHLSFNYFALLQANIDPEVAGWLMLGLFIAFAVKLPAVPFHTWLPEAHTQAPTAGSVILAGVLLKTGAYGLIRFAVPLFPEASQVFADVFLMLGLISVIYGGLVAFAQPDFKRLVAYSSIAHMGFVLLGVYSFNALALRGAVVQMVAHGFSSAALFMLAGAVQHRLHTRELAAMGGLWHSMPRMGAVMMFFVVAAVGMPGLGNFVGEFLVLLGLFQVAPWIAVVATLTLIIGATYGLRLMQRAFQGAATPGANQPPREQLHDFGARELVTFGSMMLVLLWLGLFPGTVLEAGTSALTLLPGGAP